MPNLWTPERKSPQIAPEAKDRVIDGIFSIGLTTFYNELALPLFKERYEPLQDQISRLQFEHRNATRSDKTNPNKALYAAIVVTAFAYLESGYDQPFEGDAITIADMEAEFVGVPEVYLESLADDPNLGAVLEIVGDTPEFRADKRNAPTYATILDIGGGWMRHNLQASIAS